jgi:hypothetical protein
MIDSNGRKRDVGHWRLAASQDDAIFVQHSLIARIVAEAAGAADGHINR